MLPQEEADPEEAPSEEPETAQDLGAMEVRGEQSLDTVVPSDMVIADEDSGNGSNLVPSVVGKALVHEVLEEPLEWPDFPREEGSRDYGFGGLLCELAIMDGVDEYLQFHQLHDSLALLREVQKKLGLRAAVGLESGAPLWATLVRAPSPAATLATGELSVVQALNDFDEGQRDSLFQRWSRLVPKAAASSSAGYAMELRLRVYFCTCAARQAIAARGPSEGLSASDLDFTDLKAFLASHPATALEESSESLANLFALPFVPQPHKNPGLKFVFEDEWVRKLRMDLFGFLLGFATGRHAPALRLLAGSAVSSRGPRTVPPPLSWHELVSIAYRGLMIAANAAANQEKRRAPNQSVLQEIGEARRRLAAIARMDAVPPDPGGRAASAVQLPAGEADTEAAYGSFSGALLFQDRLWPMSREAARRASSASSLDCPLPSRRAVSARSLESRGRTATALLPVPPALDFGRIAALVAGSNAVGDTPSVVEASPTSGESMPSLLAVLKAVLRRLALPDESVRPRRAFLAAFACFGALRALASRLSEIVAGGDGELTEMALAVLAVCSCEAVGRREIEAAEAQRPPGCIAALITVLGREPVSSLVHMLCLAVLQRLSLRWQLQSKMIELGAVDWVLRILRSSVGGPSDGQDGWCQIGPGGGPNAPDFSLEFTSALLMNLMLRAAGRKRCKELGAFGVLMKLIEHPNLQVRTHVNGTLYTLLGVPSQRVEAQRLGAEATFRAALEALPLEFDLLRRQLEFLLQQLARPLSDGEEDQEEGAEASVQADMDDGDNFLDEEELAAHFLLSSAAAAGDLSLEEQEAKAEAAEKEAAAAEEALRFFRATPAVADAQQRRFHAFIARSCRSLASPRRRLGSMEGGPSPSSLPMLLGASPISSPEPGASPSYMFHGASPPGGSLASSPVANSPLPRIPRGPRGPAAAAPLAQNATPLRDRVVPARAPAPAPAASVPSAPSSARRFQPPGPSQAVPSQAAPEAPRRPPLGPGNSPVAARKAGSPQKGAENSSSPGGPKARPPKPGHRSERPGSGQGSSTGSDQNGGGPPGGRQPSLRAQGPKLLHQAVGGGGSPTSLPSLVSKPPEPGQSRSQSEAPRRKGLEGVQEAAAAVEAAVMVGEGQQWRRPKPAASRRSASVDSGCPAIPEDVSPQRRVVSGKNAPSGGSLPQLPRIAQRR